MAAKIIQMRLYPSRRKLCNSGILFTIKQLFLPKAEISEFSSPADRRIHSARKLFRKPRQLSLPA
jgi:hypothetical protein